VARQTSFVFTAAADPGIDVCFSRHAGAARFAGNECLRAVKDALDRKKRDPATTVPWSGFDLINHFNAWKRSDAAGCTWAVDSAGGATLVDTGLPWRDEVCAQVFEEAAVDLSRGLDAYSKSRRGLRKGRRVGFPRFKKKGRSIESFRIRNRLVKRPVTEIDPATGNKRRKQVLDPETGKLVTCWRTDPATGREIETPTIRVGTEADARTIALPGIGTVRVIEDTRRLRRLLRPAAGGAPRTRIHFATVTARRGRWKIALNVIGPDFHQARRHRPRDACDHGGFVGLDRGLSVYALGARSDGTEVLRAEGTRALARSLPALRHASKAASRKQARSKNRAKADARLARIHGCIADRRRDFLHRQTSSLVKTHDRACLEDLAVANMIKNRHLARAVADASWGEYHGQVVYKSGWYGGELFIAPRFFASTKTCSRCGWVWEEMGVSDRAFACLVCGLHADRDLNAAVNLAAWAEVEHSSIAHAPDLEARGRVTAACGGTGAGRRFGDGGTGPATSPHREKKQEPLGAASAAERTPEKGAVGQPKRLFDRL
jgi:putative transposase